MKFDTNHHVTLRMKRINFVDPLTFHLAPPRGEHFNLSIILVLAKK